MIAVASPDGDFDGVRDEELCRWCESEDGIGEVDGCGADAEELGQGCRSGDQVPGRGFGVSKKGEV